MLSHYLFIYFDGNYHIIFLFFWWELSHYLIVSQVEIWCYNGQLLCLPQKQIHGKERAIKEGTRLGDLVGYLCLWTGEIIVFYSSQNAIHLTKNISNITWEDQIFDFKYHFYCNIISQGTFFNSKKKSTFSIGKFTIS